MLRELVTQRAEGVLALSAEIEASVRAIQSGADTLYARAHISDLTSSLVGALCYRVKLLCDSAASEEARMARFVTHSLAKFHDYRALYQQMRGGEETKPPPTSALNVTRVDVRHIELCVENGAIFLTREKRTTAEMSEEARETFARERDALRAHIEEYHALGEPSGLEAQYARIEREREEMPRELEAEFQAVSASLTLLLEVVAEERENMRDYAANAVARFSECSELYYAAVPRETGRGGLKSMYLEVQQFDQFARK